MSDKERGQILAKIRQHKTEDRDVAEQVASQLQRTEQLEQALEELQSKLDHANAELGKRDTKIKALEALELRKQDLDLREQKLLVRESKLDHQLQIAKLQLDSESARVEDHKKMVELIFRSPVTRVKGQVPVAVDGGTGPSRHYLPDGTPQMQQYPGTVASGEVDTETFEQ